MRRKDRDDASRASHRAVVVAILLLAGCQQRDYVWIMARAPAIPEVDYQRLLTLIGERGYDVTKVRKVPQQWKQ